VLYYLFKYLNQLDFPGAGLFNYLSFRAGTSFILAMVISFVFGRKIINYIRKKQIGESIRDLGLEGQMSKVGTPTMGGIIIILSIIVPIILVADIMNVYIILLLVTTLWLGILGFMDDYIKVFRKHKDGLKGKFKIVAQIGIGLIIASVMVFNKDITVSHTEKIVDEQTNKVEYVQHPHKTLETTIPFFKDNQIDYGKIIPINEKFNWINTFIYIVFIILIITFVSNGVNLTDGLDGLAAGTSSASAGVLAVFAYVSGNFILADYLSIMYLPDIGEVGVFATAFVGATIGFLWYNSYPAQIFMGDTGSLTLGGIVAVLAVLVRKEWLLPIFGGIFFVENISVMMQVTYFKYTKKKYGVGRRIFLMSPLHHHYQKKGIPEAKIVTRFIIVAILLAAISVITLKVR